MQLHICSEGGGSWSWPSITQRDFLKNRNKRRSLCNLIIFCDGIATLKRTLIMASPPQYLFIPDPDSPLFPFLSFPPEDPCRPLNPDPPVDLSKPNASVDVDYHGKLQGISSYYVLLPFTLADILLKVSPASKDRCQAYVLVPPLLYRPKVIGMWNLFRFPTLTTPRQKNLPHLL